MAARGALATQFLQDRPWNYSYGKIMLLGSDHDQVTFLHYVEHMADFPNKKIVKYKVPILKDGQKYWQELEEFNTGGDGVHANWRTSEFREIIDTFLKINQVPISKVGKADTCLIEAQELFDYARVHMIQRSLARI